MRHLLPVAVTLLGFATLPALAQAPGVIDPATGARPGHIAGIGESLPRSDVASNIGAANTHSLIAPTLPGSGLGADASMRDYLTVARAALVAGRTGQAQQSLEMAETRGLGRAVFDIAASPPPESAAINQIRDARHAVGTGDTALAIRLIDLALAG